MCVEYNKQTCGLLVTKADYNYSLGIVYIMLYCEPEDEASSRQL